MDCIWSILQLISPILSQLSCFPLSSSFCSSAPYGNIMSVFCFVLFFVMLPVFSTLSLFFLMVIYFIIDDIFKVAELLFITETLQSNFHCSHDGCHMLLMISHILMSSSRLWNTSLASKSHMEKKYSLQDLLEIL